MTDIQRIIIFQAEKLFRALLVGPNDAAVLSAVHREIDALLNRNHALQAENARLIDQWIYLDTDDDSPSDMDDSGSPPLRWVAITPAPNRPGETIEHYVGTQDEARAAVRKAAGLDTKGGV